MQRVQDPDEQRAFNLMHEGKFRAALDIFEQKGAIHWSQTTDQAAEALQRRYAGDIAAEPDRKRFIFAYTNEQVDVLNRFAREVHRQRGALAEDHTLATARGAAPFAVGDRVQFTDNAWSRKDKEAGLVNGAVGTVLAIDTGHGKPRMTVELDAAKGEEGRRVSFIVGRRPQGGRVRCHPPRLRRHHLQRAGQDPRPDLRVSFALLARGVELRGADAASRVRGDFRSSRHRRRS